MFERFSVCLAFAACSAILGGCAAPAAGGLSSAGSASTIPGALIPADDGLKTTFGGYFQIVGGSPPASAVISGTAIGVDSSGDSHATFKQTVIFTTNPNQIKDGKFSFIYQDGSRLIGRYSGTGTPPDKSGYSDGKGKFIVSKGTGRFAKDPGKTGRWTVSVQIFAPGTSPAGVLNATFQL